jgi:hypothetical protein
MRTITYSAWANASHPFVDQPGILSSADVLGPVASAQEVMVIKLAGSSNSNWTGRPGGLVFCVAMFPALPAVGCDMLEPIYHRAARPRQGRDGR